MTTKSSTPKRGEIWYVNLDPTVGAEIKKLRRCVVVSSDAVGILSLRLIAPITGWKEHFKHSFWLVKIDPDGSNGLTKDSAVDTLQLRGVDLQRFVNRTGVISSAKMEEIAVAVAGVVEYQ